MKIKFIEAIKARINTNIVEVEIEEEEITDEIIRSLYELKHAYDLPTEEVEVAIKSRNLRDS
tara:strand:- start:871 stop:1056 length:186 start_codon:yes stop_codon:yes gene_type:complete